MSEAFLQQPSGYMIKDWTTASTNATSTPLNKTYGALSFSSATGVFKSQKLFSIQCTKALSYSIYISAGCYDLLHCWYSTYTHFSLYQGSTLISSFNQSPGSTGYGTTTTGTVSLSINAGTYDVYFVVEPFTATQSNRGEGFNSLTMRFEGFYPILSPTLPQLIKDA